MLSKEEFLFKYSNLYGLQHYQQAFILCLQNMQNPACIDFIHNHARQAAKKIGKEGFILPASLAVTSDKMTNGLFAQGFRNMKQMGGYGLVQAPSTIISIKVNGTMVESQPTDLNQEAYQNIRCTAASSRILMTFLLWLLALGAGLGVGIYEWETAHIYMPDFEQKGIMNLTEEDKKDREMQYKMRERDLEVRDKNAVIPALIVAGVASLVPIGHMIATRSRRKKVHRAVSEVIIYESSKQ